LQEAKIFEYDCKLKGNGEEKDETFCRFEGPKDPFGTENLVTLNLFQGLLPYSKIEHQERRC